MVKLQDHVGQQLLMLDIVTGCSPFIRAVVTPVTDTAALAEDLEVGLNAEIDRLLGAYPYEFGIDPVRVRVLKSSGIIKPDKEREAESEALLAGIREGFRKAEDAFQEKLRTDPDYQRVGWWSIESVRHSAITHAANAKEALEKVLAAEAVGSWESPDCIYLGETLPDVIRC